MAKTMSRFCGIFGHLMEGGVPSFFRPNVNGGLHLYLLLILRTVVAVRTQSGQEVNGTVVAVRTQSGQEVNGTVVAVRTQSGQEVNGTVVAVRTQSGQEVNGTVVAVRTQSGQEVNGTVVAVRTQSGQEVNGTVVAVRTQSGQEVNGTVVAVRTQSGQEVNGTVVAVRTQSGQEVNGTVVAVRTQSGQEVNGTVVAVRTQSGQEVNGTVVAVRTQSGQEVNGTVLAVRTQSGQEVNGSGGSEGCLDDTGILKVILDKKVYKKHMLPSSHMVVEVEIWVQDVTKLDEFNSEFTLDIYVTEQWIDPALSFHHLNPCKQNLSVDGQKIREVIWTPRACFINSKMASVHQSPYSNYFLMFYANGTVWLNYRTKLTGPCVKSLRPFPFDLTQCYLIYQSYQYNMDEVIRLPPNTLIPFIVASLIALLRESLMRWILSHEDHTLVCFAITILRILLLLFKLLHGVLYLLEP